MRYSPDLLDEIRGRLPVSSVVERRVRLKRAGRERVGLSPFKNERTPSFTVNDQKGFYHCFASGEHGDIFSFVMKTEGLSFTEAVERLAAEAGVALPENKPRDEEGAQRETRIREALEEACRFFEAALQAAGGECARAYLSGRGIGAREIGAFRLGFAPDSRSFLKAHLAAKGFTANETQDAGLLIDGEGIPVSYDRFRGRVIFPILDAKKRVIAFGGRALLPEQQPKYLNSPETSLFHKGHVLFNLANAREAARASRSVIAAEGYMDVIALARAGFPNAVAPLGTALTEEQLRLLWTMAPAPVLCFDGDAAGKKAAFRAVDVALPHLEPERSLGFVFLPGGQDPDDMVRNGATAALAALLEKPEPFFEVLWRREQDRHPLERPEERAAFENRLTTLIQQIPDKSLRFHYVSAVRMRLRSKTRAEFAHGAVPDPDSAWRSRSAARANSARSGTGGARTRNFADAPFAGVTHSLLRSAIARKEEHAAVAREALLIRALISHPWLLMDFAEDIAAINFEDGACAKLRDELLALRDRGAALDNSGLLRHLCDRGCFPALERIERALTHRADAHFEPGAEKARVLEGWQDVLQLQNKAVGLKQALREAEEDHRLDQNGENFARLCAIRPQVENAIC